MNMKIFWKDQLFILFEFLLPNLRRQSPWEYLNWIKDGESSLSWAFILSLEIFEKSDFSFIWTLQMNPLLQVEQGKKNKVQKRVDNIFPGSSKYWTLVGNCSVFIKPKKSQRDFITIWQKCIWLKSSLTQDFFLSLNKFRKINTSLGSQEVTKLI